MANPFLVLGGIAVGIVTASFGILQVPGWVASAQDASAINDLSMIAAAQAASASQKGAYAGEFDQLTDGHLGLSFTVPDERVQHFTANADGWCSVAASDSGRFFGASDVQTTAVSASTLEEAIAVACGESVAPPAVTESAPSTSLTASIPVAGNPDVAFSPDGRTAYVATSSKAFLIVDTATSTITETVTTGRATSGVAVSPDGRYVAAWGRQGVYVYRADDSSLVKSHTIGYPFDFTDMTWTADGTKLVAAKSKSTYASDITYFDSSTWNEHSVLTSSELKYAVKLVALPGNRVLAYSNTLNNSYSIDLGASTMSVLYTKQALWAAAPADEGRMWVAGLAALDLVDSTTGEISNSVVVPGTTGTADLDVSPDGRWLYHLDHSHVSVLAAKTGEVIARLPMRSGSNPSIHASPDGTRVYVDRGAGYGAIEVLTPVPK